MFLDRLTGLLETAGLSKVKSTGAVASRRPPAMLVAEDVTDIPSYVVSFNVAPTVAMDIVDIFPVVNHVLRIKRIVIVNPGSATGAATIDIALGQVTNVGSGGAAGTVLPLDNGGRATGVTGGPDSAAGITARTGDTTQAPGFSAVYSPLSSITVPAAAAGFTPLTVYDSRIGQVKSITTSGGSLGISLRIPAVGAGATGFRGYVEFTVDDA